MPVETVDVELFPQLWLTRPFLPGVLTSTPKYLGIPIDNTCKSHHLFRGRSFLFFLARKRLQNTNCCILVRG